MSTRPFAGVPEDCRLSVFFLKIFTTFAMNAYPFHVSAATWTCMKIVDVKMLYLLPEIVIYLSMLFRLLRVSLDSLGFLTSKQIFQIANSMPEKSSNSRRPALRHVHAVANTMGVVCFGCQMLTESTYR
jgi:hypothetical protein